MSESPIVKVDVGLGALAEPANRLIDALADAVGGMFAPWQVRRMGQAHADANVVQARADAESELIRARTEVSIQERAASRSLAEAITHQANFENILAKAIQQLDPHHASPERMDIDWITNFFDKTRIVSDEEIQNLWAKILAEEANRPGSFSRKTINLMSNLDRRHAETFRTLCDFIWKINDRPTIIDVDITDHFYNDRGINHESMSDLFELGLVSRYILGFDSSANMIRGREPVLSIENKAAIAEYANHRVELTFPDGDRNYLWVGNWKLTQSGTELFRLCEIEPVDGFFECIVQLWEEQEQFNVTHLSNEDVDNRPRHRQSVGVSILGMFDEIHDSVPESTWDNVPTDGAINYKHYLYGWPKVETE